MNDGHELKQFKNVVLLAQNSYKNFIIIIFKFGYSGIRKYNKKLFIVIIIVCAVEKETKYIF